VFICVDLWLIGVLPPCRAAQNTARITGKVVDSLTRQPIPKVHVSCMVGTQFVGSLTEVDGSYTLTDVPPGPWPIWMATS
jgi:hypothetical protein